MAEKGHFGGSPGSRQGTYVLAPSGALLASTNDLGAKEVLKVMAAGLEAYAKLPAEERTLPKDWSLQRKRWEDSYPEGGLVLRTFVSDQGPDADRVRRNRDHVWFQADEARGWLGADPKVGDVHTVASAITERLARFHLVDNVRGQTVPFGRADVADSLLKTTVLSRDGDVARFEIRGETSAKTDGTWTGGESDWKPTQLFPRSVTTQIVGVGRYDLAANRFLQLDFVALGERVGSTNLNGRKQDSQGPSRLGWVFEIAPDRAAERIAPAYVDVYGAAWIVDPR